MKKSVILLFGKLKSHRPEGQIEVETRAEMTPRLLREVVARELKMDLAELQSCAVASSEAILHEEQPLGEGHEFSLLPPVCGG